MQGKLILYFVLSKRGNKTVTSYFYDWRVRNIRIRFIQFSTRGFNPSYRAKACICHPARSIYNKPINVYVKQKMCSKASFLFFYTRYRLLIVIFSKQRVLLLLAYRDQCFYKRRLFEPKIRQKRFGNDEWPYVCCNDCV